MSDQMEQQLMRLLHGELGEGVGQFGSAGYDFPMGEIELACFGRGQEHLEQRRHTVRKSHPMLDEKAEQSAGFVASGVDLAHA